MSTASWSDVGESKGSISFGGITSQPSQGFGPTVQRHGPNTEFQPAMGGFQAQQMGTGEFQTPAPPMGAGQFQTPPLPGGTGHYQPPPPNNGGEYQPPPSTGSGQYEPLANYRPPVSSTHYSGFQPAATGSAGFMPSATNQWEVSPSTFEEQLSGFGLGAFFWGWYWALWMRMWKEAAIMFVLSLIFTPFLANLGFAFFANKAAYKSRQFASVEEFNNVDKMWALGGFLTLGGMLMWGWPVQMAILGLLFAPFAAILN